MAVLFAVLIFLAVYLFGLAKKLTPAAAKLVLSYLQRETEGVRQLKEELQRLTMEQDSVSIKDEFPRHARLQRKISKIRDQIKQTGRDKSTLAIKVSWAISAVFYICYGLLMMSLMWRYRREPVLLLPADWLYPLGGLVAFPSGVSGAVGITFWLVVCNRVSAVLV
ncbi:guided entry of tail-anchored proteins factor 1-like [Branchiostoma floridae]|uniref:Guided entry of tail-anchored proteins factor 1 n=1 Tax=Branchiostoma floridae TaxID=7739 RepID=A0A9J7HVZ2_BRAFL|nr:guided entry of tail-anchored proteins factor 1-like [Branchiostoma floridae]